MSVPRLLVTLIAATAMVVSVKVSKPVYAAPLDRAPRATHHIVSSVDRARLEATLGVLTGQAPTTSGVTIPERGTTAGRLETRTYLTAALTAIGYEVEAHDYRSNGQNILARLPATVPTNEWILVGAHLDSVRNAGANDNGTGTACILEMAWVLRGLLDRRVNVLFVFFDEEERGLIGSYALAAKFAQEKMSLTSVHTIDMMGWDADKDRAVEIEQPDGGLWEYYNAANARHGLGLKLVRTSSGATDHVAFRESGFRSVGLCEEWVGGDTTPYYHRKSDTFATVDLDYLTSTTRLFTAVVVDLVSQVPAPEKQPFDPHESFPGRDHCGHGDGETLPLPD